MADVSKIKIKGTTYNLKDTAARASISNLPKYMDFKGTLGTGGTITSLPAASSAVVGHVYSVITAGTYAGIVTKKGDMLVCSDTPAWVILPAGEKGDKGDTGAKGETGERGPQGPKGTDGITPTIKAANGADIDVVGTPSVTATTSGTATTFTFNNLKGAKGDTGPQGPQGLQGIQGIKGDTGAKGETGERGPQGPAGVTPTIKVAAGANIGAVGTPSVTANTVGTTTTFTFNHLKGATGAQGPQGPIGVTPTIKVASGAHINATGTPSVTAATSGNTTTFTFDYLKGAQGPQGVKGDTGLQGPQGVKGDKGATGPAGPGIATGGTAGQYLVKNSTTNYDTKWATLDLSGYETKANAKTTYVAKAEATGYNDILTKTLASATYETKANASATYVSKTDAVGYDDILTKTEASGEYETKQHANATYETKANASTTYETKNHASETYPTKTEMTNAIISAIETAINSTPKTQKVTIEVTLANTEVKDQTFTFNELTTIYGVSKIERPYNTNQAYSSHQILDVRYYKDFDPITISGNTVTLKIGNRTDTTSVATWSVTAIGV